MSNPDDCADGPIQTPPWDMSDGERAAWERFAAAGRELFVAKAVLNVAAGEAAKSMQNFSAAWEISGWRIAEAEADAIAAHPDLAELDVRLDGFYGA